MEQNLKKHLFLILIYFSLFLQIKCYPDDEEMIKKLMNDIYVLRGQRSAAENDLKIYNTINMVLIGLSLFFLIIIITFLVYEIVTCCLRRKKDIIRQTLIVNNIKRSKNSKRNSNKFNLKVANDSFSSTEEDLSKSVNSFHSSHLLESNREKEDNNKSSYNINQQSNLENNIKERNNSGYVAPIIQNVNDNNIYIDYNDNNNNKDDKILTNDGNKNENNTKINISENPY